MQEGLTEQVVVRMSPTLLRWLVKDADANGRTISQSIRYYLERVREP